MPMKASDIIRDAPGDPNHPWHETLRILIDYVKEQAVKELRAEGLLPRNSITEGGEIFGRERGRH